MSKRVGKTIGERRKEVRKKKVNEDLTSGKGKENSREREREENREGQREKNKYIIRRKDKEKKEKGINI